MCALARLTFVTALKFQMEDLKIRAVANQYLIVTTIHIGSFWELQAVLEL